MIAKMDATANDVPNTSFKVEGFPTLYWVAAGAKDAPVQCDSRSYEDLVEFVEKKLKGDEGKDEL